MYCIGTKVLKRQTKQKNAPPKGKERERKEMLKNNEILSRQPGESHSYGGPRENISRTREATTHALSLLSEFWLTLLCLRFGLPSFCEPAYTTRQRKADEGGPPCSHLLGNLKKGMTAFHPLFCFLLFFLIIVFE